jgi:hypothetical protein
MTIIGITEDELTRLAEKAASATFKKSFIVFFGEEDDYGLSSTSGPDTGADIAQMLWRLDAEYFSAASPETILNLINTIHTQRKALEVRDKAIENILAEASKTSWENWNHPGLNIPLWLERAQHELEKQ